MDTQAHELIKLQLDQTSSKTVLLTLGSLEKTNKEKIFALSRGSSRFFGLQVILILNVASYGDVPIGRVTRSRKGEERVTSPWSVCANLEPRYPTITSAQKATLRVCWYQTSSYTLTL